MATQTGVVIKAYPRQFDEPMNVQAGERVRVTKRDLWDNDERYPWLWCINAQGKEGWTPESYIEMDEDGETGITTHAYSSWELTSEVNDTVQISEEAAGWYWVTNQRGQQGWVPVSHIALC